MDSHSNPFLPPPDERNILFEADTLRALIAVILQDRGLRVRGDGIDAGIHAALTKIRYWEQLELKAKQPLTDRPSVEP